MKIQPGRNLLLLALASISILGLAAMGCSSDSPSEPAQQPAPTPPGTSPPSGAFNITIIANPAELQTSGDDPSTITIQVRRRDNNQPPADLTTVVVTTTLGDFVSQGSGIRQVVAQLVNGQVQLLLFPGEAEGTAVIQARLEESFGQGTVPIRGSATFFLSFVEPAAGTPNGGDSVSIIGGGFVEPVRVTFEGVVAQVQSVSENRIRVVTPASSTPVPAGTSRPVNVAVTIRLNEVDSLTDTLASGFTYVPGGGGPVQPVVLGVNPTSGPNEGGTRVVISGDGFEAPTQVLFGGGNGGGPFIEAAVESVTRTQIVARTPAATGFGQANQNSTVDIRVRNVNSGFSTTSLSAFTYGSSVIITAVAPNRIVFDSQATVTIRGQGFEAPLQVIFPGGLLGSVISVTGTQIVVRAPIPLITGCSDLFGPIQVVLTNSGDTDDTSSAPALPDFGFQVPRPVVTGVVPTSGSGVGGTAATVQGSGFDEPVRVEFGDSSATVVSVNAAGTAISVLTPPFTQFDVVACDDNGDGQQGERFVATAVDVTVTNLATGCDDTLEGGFRYNPTDNTCRGDQAPLMPQCSDGIDNDGDTLIDFPADLECSSATDNNEAS